MPVMNIPQINQIAHISRVCVYRQKIEFELEFHEQTFFTETTDTLELPVHSIS
jgi:hypothetical protein